MEPFIGRRQEVQLVGNLLKRAQSRGLQLVILTGPSGVGKSRLLRELQHRFHHRSFAVRFEGTLDADAFFHQLGHHYPEFLVHLPRYCPVEDLHTVATRYPFLQPYLPVEPQALSSGQASPSALLFPCLQGLTEVRPLLLLVDQIASPESLSLLQHLLLQMETQAVVAILVADPDDWQAWSPLQMNLVPFTLEETREFLEVRGIHLSPQQVQHWHTVTQGLPLFLELALKASSQGPHQGLVPWIQRRFRRFPGAARRLFALLALLRTPLPREALSRLVPPSTVDRGLPPLLRQGFLRLEEGQLQPPHDTFLRALEGELQGEEIRTWLERSLWPRLLRWPQWWNLPWYRLPLSWQRPARVSRGAWARFLMQQARQAQISHEPQRALHLTRTLNDAPVPRELQDQAWFQEAQLLLHLDPSSPRFWELVDHLQGHSPSLVLKLLAIHLASLAHRRRFSEAQEVVQEIQRRARHPWQEHYAHRQALNLRALMERSSRAFQALRRFIQQTPFDDQKVMALTTLVTLEVCAHQVARALEDARWFQETFPQLPLGQQTLAVFSVTYSLAGRLQEARQLFQQLQRRTHFTYFGELFNVHYAHLFLLATEGNHAQFQWAFPRFLEQAKRSGSPSYVHSLALVGLEYFRELPDLDTARRMLDLLMSTEQASCWLQEEEVFLRQASEAWIRWHQGDRPGALNLLKALTPRVSLASPEGLSVFYRLQGLHHWEQGRRQQALKIWDRALQRLESRGYRIHLLWNYRFLSEVTGKPRFRQAWRNLALETGAVGWYGNPESVVHLALQQQRRFRLRTLGVQEIQRPGVPTPLRDSDLRYRRAWALLALLIAHASPTGLLRSSLLARLWPEATSSNPLDIVVSHLRKHTAPEFLISEGGRLRLHPQLVEVDALEFQQKIQEGLTGQPEEDPSLALERAVELYQGPFMPQVDHPEVEPFRQYLARLHRDARIRLAALALQRSAPEEAYRHAYRLLMHDPYDEEAHRLVILSFWLQGNRAAALRQYERLHRLLDQEFGVEPSREIQQVIRRIQAGERPPLPFSPSSLA